MYELMCALFFTFAKRQIPQFASPKIGAHQNPIKTKVTFKIVTKAVKS